MPRDNLSNDLNALSEKISNISLDMSDGESAFKRTIFAYMESSKDQIKGKLKTLDNEIANIKGSGLFGWFGDLFGSLFNKNKTLPKVSDVAVADVGAVSAEDSIKETSVSVDQDESIRTKMRNAGYKSIAENNGNENKSREVKNNDIQQGQ